MKKGILLLLTIVAATLANAQFSFRSGAGVTGSLINTEYVQFGQPTDLGYRFFKYQKSAFAYGALLFPKYHLNKKEVKTKYSSRRREEPEKPYDWSIGMPTMLTLNLGFVNGQNISSILYSFAPTFDLNLGSMTSAGQGKKAGAFAGLGLGLANTNQLNYSTYNVAGIIDPATVNSKKLGENDIYKPRGLGIGPVVHLGGEVINPFSRMRGNKIGLRLGYQPAINRGGIDYFAINIISSLGFNQF
jgi:hypothetical protein